MRGSPSSSRRACASGSSGRPSIRAKSLPRPAGSTARVPPPRETAPASDESIPSPPTLTTTSPRDRGSVHEVADRARPRAVGDLDRGAGVAQPPGDRHDGAGCRAAPGGRVDQERERPGHRAHGTSTPGLSTPAGSSSALTARRMPTPDVTDLAGVPGLVVGADRVVVGDRRAGREHRVAGRGLRRAPTGQRVVALLGGHGEVERAPRRVDVRDVAQHDRRGRGPGGEAGLERSRARRCRGGRGWTRRSRSPGSRRGRRRRAASRAGRARRSARRRQARPRLLAEAGAAEPLETSVTAARRAATAAGVPS